VALGAKQAGHLRFHQRLRGHPDTFAQHIAVLLLEQRAGGGALHEGLQGEVTAPRTAVPDLYLHYGF
jgi:hypothetical protein